MPRDVWQPCIRCGSRRVRVITRWTLFGAGALLTSVLLGIGTVFPLAFVFAAVAGVLAVVGLLIPTYLVCLDCGKWWWASSTVREAVEPVEAGSRWVCASCFEPLPYSAGACPKCGGTTRKWVPEPGSRGARP